MIYEPSNLAIIIFFLFVGFTIALSFYLGSRAKSAEGYFAAHGQIPWFVNGVAFAGDYLSAASFLGICGMIAFYGYDGFLYSIGFLAGWIVALFVVAEPLKRLGKFTFADALDAKFESRSIKLVAGISTLAVSIFYLIPQMVGAGVLIQPLLGFPHWAGVVLVGAVVILIVVSAGMVSTTWVQFLKGSLLVIFSAILTVMILYRGFVQKETQGSDPFQYVYANEIVSSSDWRLLPEDAGWQGKPYVRAESTTGTNAGEISIWRWDKGSAPATEDDAILAETKLWKVQTVAIVDGKKIVNGKPQGQGEGETDLAPFGHVSKLPGSEQDTGPVGPLEFFRVLDQSEVILPASEKIKQADGNLVTVYYPNPTPGQEILSPGNHPNFKGIRSDSIIAKINFLSLMLALFCGTASLPHILIRYYTVKDGAAARKSTIVGIASIGFFYVLTLYLGLGAMTSGALDVTDSNMAAPLLAKSMNELLFAIISAIAFTTVLGTVSGLILASAGAVTHDLIVNSFRIQLTDYERVRIAKIASVVVGGIAIVLGILFEKLNVGFLVGWAFSVAASANLPSLVMLLFWKGVTKQGVTAAVLVGMISSLSWILLSGDTFSKVYGLPADLGLVPFSQPGIVTIPLGFLTLIIVSLMTQPAATAGVAEQSPED